MPHVTLPPIALCSTVPSQVARKAAASAITLGSGASLGPEAPSVELGANTAAVIAPKNLSKRRQRMLIAAGAAAGAFAGVGSCSNMGGAVVGRLAGRLPGTASGRWVGPRPASTPAALA